MNRLMCGDTVITPNGRGMVVEVSFTSTGDEEYRVRLDYPHLGRLLYWYKRHDLMTQTFHPQK